MAYKFQRGAATLSGSVTIEDTLTVEGASTLQAVLSSSAAISGSNFYGDGSGLTNISSDNVDVDDSSANTEFQLVGVAASGDGVTLITMDTAADYARMNASTGKLTLAGTGLALSSAGSVAALSGHLTASKGGLFSDHVQLADGKRVVFNGDGQIRFQAASTGQSAISLTDNLASALFVGQGANTYMTFKTTNSSEAVVFGQDVDCDEALNVDGALTANGTVTLGNAASDVTTVTGHLTASKGGKFTLGVDCDSTLNADGNFTANADVTLGNAAGDVCTVTGMLTASKGALFSEAISIPAAAELNFNGAGGAIKISANGGNDLNFNTNANFVFNPGSHIVKGDTDNTVDLGGTGAQWANLWLGGAIHGEEAGNGAFALNMPDNVAEGLMIRVDGDSNWMTFKTTTDQEAIQMNKDITIDDGLGIGGAGDWALNFKASTTGQSHIALTDNLASALYVHQAGNSYLKFVTTNSSEAVVAGKDLQVGAAVGDDALLTLHSGVEYKGQETVTANKTLDDVVRSHYLCSGSAAVTLTLPACSNGYSLNVKRHPDMSKLVKIAASGSQTIDGTTTDLELETVGAAVQLVASGSSWYVY